MCTGNGIGWYHMHGNSIGSPSMLSQLAQQQLNIIPFTTARHHTSSRSIISYIFNSSLPNYVEQYHTYLSVNFQITKYKIVIMSVQYLENKIYMTKKQFSF